MSQKPSPSKKTTPKSVAETLPVLPWRVPPMGSLGDEWDQFVHLPEEHIQISKDEDERQLKRRKKRKKKLGHHEIAFLDWVPALHRGVILSWIFLGMAFASVGAIYPLMPFAALLSFLTAITSIVLIKTIHERSVGIPVAAIAIAVSIVLLVVDTLDIQHRKFVIFTQNDLSQPIATLADEDKLLRAQEDMPLLAEALRFSVDLLGDEAVAMGQNSVNYRVDPDSISYKVSSIARKPKAEFTELEEQYLYIYDAELPPDPFSDDPRGTYAAAIANGYVIIMSPGPDGEWQINPRKPVTRRVEDVEKYLEDFQYDSLTGEGDLITVLKIVEDDFSNGRFSSVEAKNRWLNAWFNQ